MSLNFARAVPTIAAITVLTVGLAASPAPAVLAAKAAPATTAVTRAALDPSLVAGRGADLGFVEQEAENAATNGTIIGPGTTAYTLPAEASGRSAVSLTPGQYVEFTLPSAANAINVRYSIPDAPSGGGITAPLSVTVNGGDRQVMTLTSQYAWLYNQYPFSNDPDAGLLFPDQWITECSCVPDQTTPEPVITTPFRPNHFYDEERLLLHRTYPAGAKIRLTVPRSADPGGRPRNPPRKRCRDDNHRPDGQPVRAAAEDRHARGERGPVRSRSDRTA